MIDLRILREDPERVRDNLRKRNMLDFPFEELTSLDKQRRELISLNQKLKTERNRISLEIGRKKRGKDEEAERLISAMKTTSETIAENDRKTAALEQSFQDLAARLPNFIEPDVPVGPDESYNKTIEQWGEPMQGIAMDHVDLSAQFELIDLERAAKTSGARFYFLKGDLVRLNYALLSYGLDFLRNRGFTLIEPPYLLKRAAIGGAIIFSDFQDVIYKIQDEDLYLIGTSEHAIAAMHMDEIFSVNELPLRYAGVSPCFRKEAGAHGKDTKGIFRVHQFDKVEQFVFCSPEQSGRQHEALFSNATDFLKLLGLPYRAVILSSGDMGKVAAKTIDIECWVPSQANYREMISCSNCTDFQARSLGIKYRERAHEESRFVHTLNSTLVASTRTMVPLLETYFRKDSNTIEIPKVLRSFMSGQEEIRPIAKHAA